MHAARSKLALFAIFLFVGIDILQKAAYFFGARIFDASLLSRHGSVAFDGDFVPRQVRAAGAAGSMPRVGLRHARADTSPAVSESLSPNDEDVDAF